MGTTRATTVRDLRRSNRARVLTEVYARGPMTRHELGAAAGVSAATISNLVGGLLEQGVLIEAGAEDSDGGRPRALLQVNPAHGYVVGVDVGETAVLVELFDLGMRLLATDTSRSPDAGLEVDRAVQQILNGLDRVVAAAGVDPAKILGVGVGVPGLVERGDDAVVHAQTLGWDAVPLGALLRAGTTLPLLVDNGAKALGQAETWWGAARHADDAVIVLLGTGVGTSIILNGEVYRGPFSSAGEWGHTTIAVDGRACRCGARGCLEAYVGARAVVSRYDELAGQAGRASAADLVARVGDILAADPRDGAAAQVLAETATYLGAGIADLVNLFNPQRIVVGGWLGRLLGEGQLAQVRAVASQHALRLPFSQVDIVLAELGTDAVALGAATLPTRAFLASGAAPAVATPRPRPRPLPALVTGRQPAA